MEQGNTLMKKMFFPFFYLIDVLVFTNDHEVTKDKLYITTNHIFDKNKLFSENEFEKY